MRENLRGLVLYRKYADHQRVDLEKIHRASFGKHAILSIFANPPRRALFVQITEQSLIDQAFFEPNSKTGSTV